MSLRGRQDRGNLVVRCSIHEPDAIRQRDSIEPGQEFEVERIDRGQYQLKRKERRRNEGLVKLLLACPVKGWFIPMRRSETTDEINVPRLG